MGEGSQIPREAFLREPVISQVRLSPDGRWLAFLKHDGDTAQVLLQDVTAGRRTRLVASVRGAMLAWSGDSRRLWIGDADGLTLGDPQTRSARRIVKWNPRRAQELWSVDAQVPAYAVVHERIGDGGRTRHHYSRVDANGDTARLLETDRPLRDLLLDRDGALAFTAGYDGTAWDTTIRRHGPDGAQELLRCTGIETCSLAGADPTRAALWVLSQHGEDLLALQRWQADTGWNTVQRDPKGIADADSLLWNVASGHWRALAYYGERRHWYAQEAKDQAVLDALARQLPDANLDLSTSSDGSFWLVRAQQSNQPVDRHFLYRADTGRLQPLFERDDAEIAALPPERLVLARPYDWTASDGMRLHGYLYLPRSVEPAQAPLIAWLHGGPIARNQDAYDPGVQMLVDRGNAVFLPNFRASSGYGLRYVRAAKGDVGNGRVLADVIEGLDALLAEGIGDRDRQAVVGHSFGGYAALLAVSHRPDRFRFAFAGAPPTDYGWIKAWQAEHDTLAARGDLPPLAVSFFHHGFPYANADWRARMRRESPLAAVAALQAPVYLWAGAKDDRVPIKSIVHYAGAVRSAHQPISLLIDPDDGHTAQTPLGIEAWLYLMETAVQRHFGGTVAAPSPALAAFLAKNWRIDDR